MSNWTDVAREYLGWNRHDPKQRILITGGAGFIGSHLVDLHLARGDSVHVVDDLSTGSQQNLEHHADNQNLQFDKADITDWKHLSEALEWADRAYHLAAIVGVKRVISDPLCALDKNLGGTRRLLEAAANAKWQPRVLIASSSEVYGFNSDATFREDSDLVFHSKDFGRWSYALAKLGDEFYASAFHEQHGLPVTTARIFNTIGPRQSGSYGMVVPNFVSQAVAGEPITVFGDGHQTRSFGDVRDTVRALDAIAASDRTVGTIINVGGDREISILELAELVKATAESASPIEFKSYEVAYGSDFADITHRVPNLSKLRDLTEFEPAWNLERTIADLVARERSRIETNRNVSPIREQAG